jgi:hypothetical protein
VAAWTQPKLQTILRNYKTKDVTLVMSGVEELPFLKKWAPKEFCNTKWVQL